MSDNTRSAEVMSALEQPSGMPVGTGSGDQTEQLVAQVRRAYAERRGLCIRGSGSKSFLTAVPDRVSLEPLDVAEHQGIIDYRPEELVVTARAGTPLGVLETLLSDAGQYLSFEPPRFGAGGTLGGAVAVGLSGPGRPWWGSVRDAVLGVELVNGYGEHLRFGGQVMKNVAGFDLSRLQVGAFGTLGVLLSVSVKVLPRPSSNLTRVFELDAAAAIARCRAWARQPLPLSAACHAEGLLRVRLSGAEAAVTEAARRLGGETPPSNADAPDFWARLRDGALPLSARASAVVGQVGANASDLSPLWRVTLPPAATLPGAAMINWAGGERWFLSEGPEAARALVRDAAAVGGRARAFAGDYGRSSPSGSIALYAARLRAAFDPEHILNPHLGPTHAH